MTIELSLMVVSAAVITFLYLHNHFEGKLGITTKVHAVRAKTDPIIENVQEKTNSFLSHLNLHNLSIFAHNLFVYTGRFFMHLSRKMHDSSARLVEKASRRKENLAKAGAASFYLKQIKDAKDSIEKTNTGVDTENM